MWTLSPPKFHCFIYLEPYKKWIIFNYIGSTHKSRLNKKKQNHYIFFSRSLYLEQNNNFLMILVAVYNS